MRTIVLHNGRILDTCVYCEGRAESRDHVIARCLLSGGKGIRMPTVPACRSCNRSFARHEDALSLMLRNSDQIKRILHAGGVDLQVSDEEVYHQMQKHAACLGPKIGCGLVAYRWGELCVRSCFGPVRLGSEAFRDGLIWSASVEGSWPIKDFHAPEENPYAFVRHGGRIYVLVSLGILHMAVQCPEFRTDGAL